MLALDHHALTLTVDDGLYGLKMTRVHTGAVWACLAARTTLIGIVTEMIDLVSLGDRPYPQLIDQPMSIEPPPT